MASTRLVRKELRNRTVSKKRVNNIKRLTRRPVIKNVDIEQIKEEFAKMKAAQTIEKEAPAKEEPKVAKEVVETPKVEIKAEKVKTPKAKTEAVPEGKEEKEAAPKKAPVKKAVPKAKKETGPKVKKKEASAE